ncbi:MAG: hypothetical protein V7752_18905, partial [Halopseudomonas sp.]
EKRFRFGIVRARAYSRLLALATYLSDQLDEAALANRAGLTGLELLAFCNLHIDALVKQIKTSRTEYKRLYPVLDQALALYHLAYIANRKTDREYQDFQSAVKRWKKKLSGLQDQEVGFQEEGHARGLQIVEDSIYLLDRDKLKVVQALSRHFRHQRRTLEDPAKKLRSAKQLAIRVALALDETINLRRPEVQRAIYNANTINMGVFERDLSTKTKIGWGEALSKEIEKDMRSASQDLVAAIYRFYGLKLDPQSRQQLAERYGASDEQLNVAYQAGRDQLSYHQRLPARPFSVPRASLEWRLARNKPSR